MFKDNGIDGLSSHNIGRKSFEKPDMGGSSLSKAVETYRRKDRRASRAVSRRISRSKKHFLEKPLL